MNSIILRGTTRPLAFTLAVVSTVVLVRGHDAPGGGFIGGLLMVSAFALYLIAFGVDATEKALRVDPRSLVAIGLVALTGGALAPMVLGGGLLEAQWWFAIPGVTKVGTVLIFDVGVYLVVCGAAVSILLTLARSDATRR